MGDKIQRLRTNAELNMLNYYDYFFRLYFRCYALLQENEHWFPRHRRLSWYAQFYLLLLFPLFFPEFMFAYLLYLQQLELYSLPQILFAPYRYKRPSEGKSRLPFLGYKPRDGLINLICVSAGA